MRIERALFLSRKKSTEKTENLLLNYEKGRTISTLQRIHKEIVFVTLFHIGL